jgi:hypothetical protein
LVQATKVAAPVWFVCLVTTLSIATDLRRILGTLALGTKDRTASIEITDCCCTPCRSRIDTLDELINNVM